MVSLSSGASFYFPSLARKRRHGCLCSLPFRPSGTESAKGDLNQSRAEQLKEGISRLLSRSRPTADNILLIDELQHLGIAYHFKEEISDVLDHAADSTNSPDETLFQAATRFRVFRYNGYNVSPGLFHKFLNEEAKSMDWRGLLSLYEASQYGTNDEEILSNAMDFSKKKLLAMQNTHLTPQKLVKIADTIGYPRHQRIERFETWRWIQEGTGFAENSSPILEFAAIDYKMVQVQHQKELAELTRWWKDLCLGKKISFARDQPLEFFLWATGIFPDPTQSVCRMELARFVPILLLLDALYDNYGSLEELTLFTDAIRRWDLEAMEKLPEIMKLCYLAAYNLTNEVGYKVLVSQGKCVIDHLRQTLVDMCEAFLKEAEWSKKKTVPREEEYLKNGIVSTGTSVASLQAFFLLGAFSDENFRLVTSPDGIFSHSGKIFRLWNDLATFKEEEGRGEVATIIECCKRERGLSTSDEARSHVKGLISAAWKDLNRAAITSSSLPISVVHVAFNLARTSQGVYQKGEVPTAPSPEDMVKAMFFLPPA